MSASRLFRIADMFALPIEIFREKRAGVSALALEGHHHRPQQILAVDRLAINLRSQKFVALSA